MTAIDFVWIFELFRFDLIYCLSISHKLHLNCFYYSSYLPYFPTIDLCLETGETKKIKATDFSALALSSIFPNLILFFHSQDIVAVGVTNQRESTIIWDRHTGKPMYNAIIWMDVRTSSTVDALVAKSSNKDKDYFQKISGLPLSTYFSGVKLRWLKDNVPEIAEAINKGDCLFGTIDTWLLYHLTGGTSGGVHVTDVTNASRTMLMNIRTCQWDPEMLEFFEVPVKILPEIRSSSEVYGRFSDGALKVCYFQLNMTMNR